MPLTAAAVAGEEEGALPQAAAAALSAAGLGLDALAPPAAPDGGSGSCSMARVWAVAAAGRGLGSVWAAKGMCRSLFALAGPAGVCTRFVASSRARRGGPDAEGEGVKGRGGWQCIADKAPCECVLEVHASLCLPAALADAVHARAHTSSSAGKLLLLLLRRPRMAGNKK